MKSFPYLLTIAAISVVLYVWLSGTSGCNPPPESHDRAVAHGDSARIAEQVADTYAAMVLAMRDTIADQRTIIAEARAKVRQTEIVADRANAEADRLLALYRGTVNGTTGGTVNVGERDGVNVGVSCPLALDACTTARQAQARVIEAQRVEIAALRVQVNALSRLDSLRAGETAALREAYEQMSASAEGYRAAYEDQRRQYLREKRRRVAAQVGAVVMVGATVWVMR